MWNIANLISCISSLKTQSRLLVQFPHNGTEFEKFCTHFLHLLQCDQSGQRWSKCHLLILLWLNDTACTWCSGITKYMTQEDPKDQKDCEPVGVGRFKHLAANSSTPTSGPVHYSTLLLATGIGGPISSQTIHKSWYLLNSFDVLTKLSSWIYKDFTAVPG